MGAISKRNLYKIIQNSSLDINQRNDIPVILRLADGDQLRRLESSSVVYLDGELILRHNLSKITVLFNAEK